MSQYLSPETIRLLLVLVATIVAHFIGRRMLQHAEKISQRTENIWDDSLIGAAQKPLPVLIWLSGISFALHLIHRQTGEQLLEYLPPARTIGVTLCIAWFLFRLIRELANNVTAARTQAGQEIDLTTVTGLSKVSRIVVLVIAGLTVMQTLGFSISGVLAFGGMGGIAVGFAAKDMLSNFFGGLVVHLDRPFNVGEFICLPDQNIMGTVENIGWRQTCIRSPDKTVMYIPNAIFTSIVVENRSRRSHLRLDLTIGLRYEDLSKVAAVSADIQELLKNCADIDREQVVAVGLDEFADSSLNLKVLAFTPVTDLLKFRALKQGLLLQISAILGKHGADMPFPTRTLHIVKDNA
ncbi:MAG: mechanosensitive ion channel family protein [Sideroxydans sp.]|nr:mechanosensitive ion channel family protein [Sideroxydans sp.]